MKFPWNKTIFWTVPALALVLLITLIMRNPTNVACTSPDHADPGLRTRQYPRTAGLSDIRQVAEETISDLKTYGRRWRLREAGQITPPDSILTIKAEVPVLVFTDDLEVTIKTSGDGRYWLVDVRSASRTGKSDLGENRRHVRQLIRALDKKLLQ